MQKTLPQSAGWHGDPRRGAAMGRVDTPARSPLIPRKFTLQRIRINGGGYDSGGAYWGTGAPLYWANWEGTGADSVIEFFFRASDRAAAKAEVVRRHPGATFYR